MEPPRINRRDICLEIVRIATDAEMRLIKLKTGAYVKFVEKTFVQNALGYSMKLASAKSVRRCGKQKGEAALSLNVKAGARRVVMSAQPPVKCRSGFTTYRRRHGRRSRRKQRRTMV